MIYKLLPYFLALIITSLVFVYGLNSSSKNSVVEPLQSAIPEPTPRLEKINYDKENVEDGWVKITSQNYSFEIFVPEDSIINTGGGFSRDYPESESKSLSISTPLVLANIVVGINFSFNNSNDLKEYVKELNSEYLGSSGIIKPTGEVKQKDINNIEGYEISFVGPNSMKSTNFYTVKDDRLLGISYSFPWNGTSLTGREKEVARKIVNSFRYTNK